MDVTTHTDEARQLYRDVLEGTSVQSRYVLCRVDMHRGSGNPVRPRR
jgi:hypothetical protein